MQALDTNILVYAVDELSEFHIVCRQFLDRCREGPTPTYISWNVGYEFLRVMTHPKAVHTPLTASRASDFLQEMLAAPGVEELRPTHRHAGVLAQTLAELPEARGNLFHDLHTAVLMREHGIGRICTRDADFRRFPFLTVVDPVSQNGGA